MQNYEIILILYYFGYKKIRFLTIIYHFEYSSDKEKVMMAEPLIVSTVSTQSVYHIMHDGHQEQMNQCFCLYANTSSSMRY